MVDRGCGGGPRCPAVCVRLLGEAPHCSSQLLGRDGVTIGENHIDFGLDGRWRRHRRYGQRHLPRAAPGETVDLGISGSDDDGIFDAVLPPWGIVSKQVLTGRAQRQSGVFSSASMTTDLGGVAQ
jgi:hypothetical protein